MNKTSIVRNIFDAKRIVVKIGSSLLVDTNTGLLRTTWLRALAQDIKRFRDRGQEIIIVSSGAVALGRNYLDIHSPELRLEEKQAAAAAGMVRLAHAYQEAFESYRITIAQILLTRDDSENRRRYLNARSTLMTLLKLGSIPLINENDTVATEEIRFGDNDRLAARVGAMISADLLILLSDIDGLYSSDPNKNSNAKLVPEVSDITMEIESMAGEAQSNLSSGGMVTKILAAKECLEAGCSMLIAKGSEVNPLLAIENEAKCTWFRPNGTPYTARKKCIASTLKPIGSFVVDMGAIDALKKGKSLLPAGVISIIGEFQRGDSIAIETTEGIEIGRGLSAYSSNDAQLIMGHKSREIYEILGYHGRDELIHRDDLVLN